ncbi:MAG: nucleotidyltransferase domain-containing protein [Gammaproteobacteria bacterium]
MADVLREALLPLAENIDAAFIFGSVAQGKEGPASDVDVMVVGSPSFDSVVEAVYGARDRLRREVNPSVMPTKSFRSKLANRERFVSRIMSEPKIVLMGDLDELGKSAQDRAA